MNISELKAKYPSVELNFSYATNCIILRVIHIPEYMRNNGVGTDILSEFTKYCDEFGFISMLTPTKIDNKTNLKRLVKFYRKFGFVMNRGKNKRFDLPQYQMIRLPKIK